jgi:hypothetical protein
MKALVLAAVLTAALPSPQDAHAVAQEARRPAEPHEAQPASPASSTALSTVEPLEGGHEADDEFAARLKLKAILMKKRKEPTEPVRGRPGAS